MEAAVEEPKIPVGYYGLDERFRVTLRWIVQFMNVNPYPPTLREIESGVPLSSTSVVHYHLARLKRAGLIDWESGTNRSIHLVGQETVLPAWAKAKLP